MSSLSRLIGQVLSCTLLRLLLIVVRSRFFRVKPTFFLQGRQVLWLGLANWGQIPIVSLLFEWCFARLLECRFVELLRRKARSLRQQVVPINLLGQAVDIYLAHAQRRKV